MSDKAYRTQSGGVGGGIAKLIQPKYTFNRLEQVIDFAYHHKQHHNNPGQGSHGGLLRSLSPVKHLIKHRHNDPDCRDSEYQIYFHRNPNAPFKIWWNEAPPRSKLQGNERLMLQARPKGWGIIPILA